MVNILMFGMSSYPGGIESYILNTFCHKDVSEKIHIDFVTYESKLAYEEEIRRCGHTIIFAPHLKKNPLGYRKCVKQAMADKVYDCVYVNMLTAANILPVALAKQAGIKKIIVHAHANSTIKGVVRKTLHAVNGKFCNKAATLRLACSKQAAAWLYDETIGASPIVVVPNAIDTKRFCYDDAARETIRAQHGIAKHELLLGSVGRLGVEKNNRFMIDVLQGIKNKGVDAKLLLVGDGALKTQLVEAANTIGLQEHVIFAGTRFNTEEYYSAFDVFLFPSLFEGFGIAALEAQSCGVPCLCSDQLSRELDVSGTVTFLPINHGVESWISAIEQLASAVPEKVQMNRCIEKSDYSVTKQREILRELLMA